MRIWIDMTAPAHPVVFRPIVNRLRAAGHDVEITARDYAQTVELLDRMGIEYTLIGTHGGASRSKKVARLLSRTAAMRKFGRERAFDLALAHGSNDLPLATAVLGIPEINMFDYEWAVQQHHVGCRIAKRVLTPDAIPPERLMRYRAGPGKLVQYPGLKEEYYLADFKPDPEVPRALGLEPGKIHAIVRPPPDVSLYHRKSNPLFVQVLNHLGSNPDVQALVIPRTDQQRQYVRGLGLPSLSVPDHAVDAQSLIALADLVVSAGGTMNREAVALGTPVYTTFGGRLGGVDESLIREGRLRPLTDPRAIELVKMTGEREVHRRDPDVLVDLILNGASDGSPAGLRVTGTVKRQSVVPPSENAGSIARRYAEMAHSDFARRPMDGILRAVDVVVSAACLLVFSPLIVGIGLALWATSGRPILYRGARVGRAGRVFTMAKFRTLTPDAESRLAPYLGAELTRLTEGETTFVGRMLRASQLDELPQLVNVLKGDMSIVGPRPIRPLFFEELCAKIPQYWQRLVVRPGITGFAQIRITREMTWEEKLAHDMEYIADRSVHLYFRILSATLARIARRVSRAWRRSQPAQSAE